MRRLHLRGQTTDASSMDAATWLRQMGGESAQTEKRAQLAELCNYLAGLDSLDSLLFEAMERVAAFFGAERAAAFVPDLDNQLRAVAWVSDSVRELRLPRDPSNLVGWAATARSPASVRNVWELAELVRLHPRLRPDDRLDQWLGLRMRSVILAPLLDHDQEVGVLLIANRADESGVFPARDVGYAGEVAKVVAGSLATQLGLRTSVQPVAAKPTPAPARRPSEVQASIPTIPTPCASRLCNRKPRPPFLKRPEWTRSGAPITSGRAIGPAHARRVDTARGVAASRRRTSPP